MSYPMASVIRLTLVGLYLALVAPLPWLAPATSQPGAWVALGLGLVLILALTSEQVELDDSGIRVGHPPWCRWFLRRGWALNWPSISALTPVATSQGGRVFYVRSPDGSAFLLPQRVANFDDFLCRFGAASGIDTISIGRISPPWTYQLLAGLSAILLLAELVVGLGMAVRS
jgi:hypothetical protein